MVFCQDALLWNNTKCLQKCLHKPHRPVEDMITLLSQPEFSNSRAALASVTRGNTIKKKNNGAKPAAPAPPSHATLWIPLLKITSNEPLISHTGADPIPKPCADPHNISLNTC